jgi:hypothetical protein
MHMTGYFKTKKAYARYVSDLLIYLKQDCVLITIIRQEKSGGYCVTFAIEESSDDIEVLHSLKQPLNT